MLQASTRGHKLVFILIFLGFAEKTYIRETQASLHTEPRVFRNFILSSPKERKGGYWPLTYPKTGSIRLQGGNSLKPTISLLLRRNILQEQRVRSFGFCCMKNAFAFLL